MNRVLLIGALLLLAAGALAATLLFPRLSLGADLVAGPGRPPVVNSVP